MKSVPEPPWPASVAAATRTRTRASGPRARGLCAVLLAALVQAGCAVWSEGDLVAPASPADEGAAAPRDARERTMQQQWIGRTRQELQDAMGAPHLVLGVPGRRWPDTMVLVYRGRDAQGGCIDAFVVHRLDREPISNYFCR